MWHSCVFALAEKQTETFCLPNVIVQNNFMLREIKMRKGLYNNTFTAKLQRRIFKFLFEKCLPPQNQKGKFCLTNTAKILSINIAIFKILKWWRQSN